MNDRVLLIEDDRILAESIGKRLSLDGYETTWVESGEAGLEKARAVKYDVAILDFKLPGMDGLDILKKLKKQSPGTSVIFFTSHGNHVLAMKSLQLGASEYINKPFNFDNLSFYVYKLFQNRKVCDSSTSDGRTPLEKRIIHQSAVMKKIVSKIPLLASAGLPILIYGETGTGKDLLAETIIGHPDNPRAGKPRFAVNCMAIPDNIVESELFGHVKGAFTGALLDKKGFFEEADGGSLFLDEISGTTPGVQGKLLRVLENGEFYRVGDTSLRRTDVHIIAATNKDLAVEVKNGNFREDLFYRLKGLHVCLPPLRERREDIAPLLQFFLDSANEKYGKKVYFTERALSAMENADWPGNARQLKIMVTSAVAMSEKGKIDVDHLSLEICEKNNQCEAPNSALGLPKLKEKAVAEVEKEYLISILRKTGGKIGEAAAEMGIARQNFTKKIKKLGIRAGDFK